MFVFTKDFAYNGLMDFGAGFWPRIIAVIMMVCAVLLSLLPAQQRPQNE